MEPESNFPAAERTWVEVDLAALIRNAATVAARVPGARLLPMVKADAYGLGAVPVAHALESLDPWGYGVATAGEGAELREAGIRRPILVLAPTLGQLAATAQFDLTPALGSLDQVRAWIAVAAERPFQVQVDTGMCRSGIWWEAFGPASSAFRDAPGFEGVLTHFHSADESPPSVTEQIERFRAALASLPRRPKLVHAANSAAALRHRDVAAFDLVRPGIYLYGGVAGTEKPEPVVSWRARIAEVNRRPAGVTVSYGATWRATAPVALATVAAGYADGLPRAVSNKGSVLIGGRRFGIVGRVTMDLTVVASRDVIPDANGVATIIGRDGAEEITVDELALRAGTISYEVLTGIGRRVPRVYR